MKPPSKITHPRNRSRTWTWATAVLAAVGFTIAAAPAQSAINWFSVRDLVDQTDVATSGKLCIAVNLGPEVCEKVINGVHFQADRGHWNKKHLTLGGPLANGVMYWPDFTSGGYTFKAPDWKRTDLTGSGLTPDAAYNVGLDGARHAEPNVQVDVNTVTGLTPGNTYMIQIWCAWSRAPQANKTQGRVTEWDNGVGGREGAGGIFMTTNNAIRGQVATGFFTASASGTQTFTSYQQPADTTKTPPLKDTWGLLNMFQIRDVSTTPRAAGATYFGEGTPGTQTGGGRGPGLAHMYGTNCSPAISLTGHPVLNSTVNLTAENSLHQPSSAIVALGVNQIRQPWLMGELLVFPVLVLPVPMPWTILPNMSFTPDHELQIPVTMPATPVTLFVQVLQLDAGAAGGVSFTPGMKIEVGT